MTKTRPEIVVFIFLVVFSLIMPQLVVHVRADSSFPHWSPPRLGDNSTDFVVGSVCPSSFGTQQARSINTSITIPSSAPNSDENYAILLSAYDSNGSYDQIGFDTYYNGLWGLTYSWTTGPLGGATYYPLNDTLYHNEMNLSMGSTYAVSITVQNLTAVFTLSEGGTVIWSQNAPTGGNYLNLTRFINNTDYFGYTDYEEVNYADGIGGAPSFDFYFTNQYWADLNGSSHTATSWERFDKDPTTPSGVDIEIDGNSVFIVNPGAPPPHPVDITVNSVDPLPPHYSVFQVYHHGMRLDGQNISMNYTVTVGRTDIDTFGVVYVGVGLNRTNVNNASDCRNMGTATAILGPGGSYNRTFVWNETDTLNPGTYSITGYANVLNDTAFDINPSNNQLTNDTVQAKELVGDANGDGTVDIYDAVLLSLSYGMLENETGYNPDANFITSPDGATGLQIIDIYDAIALGSHYEWNIDGPLSGCMSSKGGMLAATAGASSIIVDPSQINVFKGEVFSVNVEVTSSTDLYGWEFKLYWNSSVLNCTNVAVQTPTEWQNSTQTFGTGLEANYNATYSRYWQGQSATYPASSFNGSMTMVTLTFQALQPGSTSLTLADVKLGNSTAEPIACSVSSGSVSVYYGRYLRSDTQTVNGLGAYILNIPESTSSAAVTQSGDGQGASWGIRAFVRHSNGVEQEISLDGQTGTPKAVVYRTGGSGMQSNTVSVAQTALLRSPRCWRSRCREATNRS